MSLESGSNRCEIPSKMQHAQNILRSKFLCWHKGNAFELRTPYTVMADIMELFFYGFIMNTEYVTMTVSTFDMQPVMAES